MAAVVSNHELFKAYRDRERSLFRLYEIFVKDMLKIFHNGMHGTSRLCCMCRYGASKPKIAKSFRYILLSQAN